jgi:P pilus assembly chaperone PapD
VIDAESSEKPRVRSLCGGGEVSELRRGEHSGFYRLVLDTKRSFLILASREVTGELHVSDLPSFASESTLLELDRFQVMFRRPSSIAAEDVVITNPTDSEVRVRTKLEKSGGSPLRVSPSEFGIEPGEERLVRIMRQGSLPSSTELSTLRLSASHLDGRTESIALPVLAMPSVETVTLTTSRLFSSAIVENTGTVHVTLHHLQRCGSASDCEKLNSAIIAPRQRLIILLAPHQSLHGKYGEEPDAIVYVSSSSGPS